MSMVKKVAGTPTDQDQYGLKESEERFEAALRGALKTSPKPLKAKPRLRESPLRAPAKKAPRKT